MVRAPMKKLFVILSVAALAWTPALIGQDAAPCGKGKAECTAEQKAACEKKGECPAGKAGDKAKGECPKAKEAKGGCPAGKGQCPASKDAPPAKK